MVCGVLLIVVKS